MFLLSKSKRRERDKVGKGHTLRELKVLDSQERRNLNVRHPALMCFLALNAGIQILRFDRVQRKPLVDPLRVPCILWA